MSDQLPQIEKLSDALQSLSLPDVCTDEALAEHTGIALEVVRQALARGDLPGRAIGGHWLISRRALLGWLERPLLALVEDPESEE